ncbi:hypothetical protein OH76DRAFT_793111 [Lentinus brumalis]|uniref:Uncharacterized protein n=1 Tax=Lentinus brumalis TaxID=2498619 RepID=A0A371D3I3_9APHY|nr:hypothetical protein OH76DRAFT_793111 [Polyporus brumalis]
MPQAKAPENTSKFKAQVGHHPTILPRERREDRDGDHARYMGNLLLLKSTATQGTYEQRRLRTGVAKPSIFSGLPRAELPPRGLRLDRMHHISLNLTDLEMSILRGPLGKVQQSTRRNSPAQGIEPPASSSEHPSAPLPTQLSRQSEPGLKGRDRKREVLAALRHDTLHRQRVRRLRRVHTCLVCGLPHDWVKPGGVPQDEPLRRDLCNDGPDLPV